MASSKARLIVALAVAIVLEVGLVGANFRDECDIPWNPQNAKFTNDGSGLALSLVSNTSGCLIRTKKQFIYGSVSTEMQLVPGHSAGTVTTYYTSSTGDKHDEIDYEFLGNETGKPYTFHTNIFANGEGEKEMQFRPWFDPTTGFHIYTIFWSPCMIVWSVDDFPIRVFRNYENKGIPFPTSQPMSMYSSIWAAENWATQGGRIKTNWTKAPFVANYRNMDLKVCECYSANCAAQCASLYNSYTSPYVCKLSDEQRKKLQWVQSNYTIYNYCEYKMKKTGTMPLECTLDQF